MTKLIPITLFAMLMAVLSHRHSLYDPINSRYQQKERLFYTIMAVGMILFAGLRTIYNDTVTYEHLYHLYEESGGWFDAVRWHKLGENPGYMFMQAVFLELGVDWQTVLMLYSAFMVSVNLWFLRKYSCNLWLSVLIFIMFDAYIFTMAAIKQCTAMALCLIATDRAIHKKYISFLIFVYLGALFHPYSLMYLIVPFMTFRPWSKYTLLMLTIFGLVGVGMESLLGTLLSVTDMLGEHYDAKTFIGEGINPFRLLITAVPSVLALLTAKQIQECEEKDQYVIVNLSMLNAEIMFVALFGTANYFGRLANYFLPFQALAIPWLLKHYDHRGRRTMHFLATGGYLLYYIYSMSIHSRFDTAYYGITLSEYLKNLFHWGGH